MSKNSNSFIREEKKSSTQMARDSLKNNPKSSGAQFRNLKNMFANVAFDTPVLLAANFHYL